MNEPLLCAAADCASSTASGEGLVRAVDDVDIDVARGEMLAVMGPSGCGKSTLLHLLGGLDRPTSGELSLAGRRIDRLSERALAQLRRHEVGFVFQAYHLMDELTAQENVELPALLAGRDTAAGSAIAHGNCLSRSGLQSAPIICRLRCRVVNDKEWRSRGHSPTTRSWFSPTSPPETSTVPQRLTCCGSSRHSTTVA